jgi:formyltetrahydrofolate deformylase
MCNRATTTTTFVAVTRRSSTPDMGRLLVSCPDRPGIIAAVSRFLFEHGANIAESGQFSTDPEGGRFFLRNVFHRPGLQAMRDELERRFAAEVGEPFGMQWTFADPGMPTRVAIMVSR